MSESLDYRKSGVDIDAAEKALKLVKTRIQATQGARVLGRYGTFSGLFDLKGLGKDPVLVASCDGVGTKLKLAFRTGRHTTIGQDLVNHCVNDIACCGARPLFFLDYLAIEKLTPEVFAGILEGLSTACLNNGMALLGGETAELPGLYHPGEYDLAGTIIGWVERDRIIDGSRIAPGDVALGLASTGLHTNGYSLALKALFEVGGMNPEDTPAGWERTLAEELMQIHRSYGDILLELFERYSLHGIAHITGGGFEGNIPRILPENVALEIDATCWKVPPVFGLIQECGNVRREEMYRVFNMGVGLVLLVAAQDAKEIASVCEAHQVTTWEIGHCHEKAGEKQFELKF